MQMVGRAQGRQRFAAFERDRVEIRLAQILAEAKFPEGLRTGLPDNGVVGSLPFGADKPGGKKDWQSEADTEKR